MQPIGLAFQQAINQSAAFGCSKYFMQKGLRWQAYQRHSGHYVPLVHTYFPLFWLRPHVIFNILSGWLWSYLNGERAWYSSSCPFAFRV